MIMRSILLFVLAGICEIGGGYLIWLWLREGKPTWYGVVGACIMALYGVIATLQPADFGRTYATYGGFFILLSLIWGWKTGAFIPDRYDLMGGAVAMVGVLIIYYGPRT
jgi:small multidrug resistance family-3 protein